MVLIVLEGLKPVRIGAYSYGFLLPKRLFKEHSLSANKSYEVIINEK